MNISNYNHDYRIEIEDSKENPLLFKAKLFLSSDFVYGPILNLYINLTFALKQIKIFYFTKINLSVNLTGESQLNPDEKILVENTIKGTKIGQDAAKVIVIVQNIWSVGSSFVLEGMMIMQMINLLRYIEIK